MLENQIRGLERRREKLGYRTFREQEELLRKRADEIIKKEKDFLENYQKETGSVRLINGSFISREEYSKRKNSGEKLELWEDR